MKTLLAVLAVAAGIPAATAATPPGVVIDAQEWRDQPLRHYYIHGVLNGHTAFQIRLPEKAAWKGRLLHFLEGSMGGYEKTGESIGEHAYALANGAVYVESSQGHRSPAIYRPEDTLSKIAYEASYSVVMYARSRCLEFYGREPDYSYIYGQSGGGFRSTGLLERYPKLYDGAVPIFGAGQMKALLLYYSIYQKYRSALAGYGPALAETMRPGGSGDPFAVLPSAEARSALKMILTAGFPLSQVEKIEALPTGILVLDILRYKVDSAYLTDFWTKPGYPGADGLEKGGIVEFDGEVKSVSNSSRMILLAAALDHKPANLSCFTLRFTSGALAGEIRHVAGNKGETLMLSSFGPDLRQAKPGDRFHLDNRDALAIGEYYRYIGDRDGSASEGFWPAKPVRPADVMAAINEAGRPIGNFRGKMIAVFSVDDDAAWPTLALRYKRQVEKALGSRTAARRFRLHFIEKAPHSFTVRSPWEISWFPPVHKMMDDLMAWVERGTPPAAETRYSVSELSQIVLPKNADERRGYQPLATLTANDKPGSVEVPAGAEVVFKATAEDPDNDVVRLEMDFDSDGKFDASAEVRGRKVSHTFRHVYGKPGIQFATVRVTDSTASQGSAAGGIQNVAHIRVVVRENQAAKPASESGGIRTENDIVYGQANGRDLRLDLARPASGAGPFPGVVCIHGGGWQLGNKEVYRSWIKRLAARGYVAATVEYRLAPSYRWPAQIQDVQCAVRYLRANAARLQLDAGRIGAFGESAGAHLSLLLGLMDRKDDIGGCGDQEIPSKVQAVVDFYGPTDFRAWRLEPEADALVVKVHGKNGAALMEDLSGARDRAAPVIAQLSPVTYVDRGDPPVLIVHGSSDILVPIEQARILARALAKNGIPHRLEVVPGAGHGWAGQERERTLRLAIDFFDTHLKQHS